MNLTSSEIAAAVQARWDSLTKPRGSLGVLESSVIRLAQLQHTVNPSVDRRAVYVFCGDHGITAEGVSLYPQAVTREMVRNFVRGGAAINVLCRQLGIETRIINAGVAGEPIEGALDLCVANGTRNFLREPAMSRAEASTAIARGRQLAAQAAESFDIVGVGEMGIGNTTAASAILCALTGISPEQAAGRGAGLEEAGIMHKRAVLARALSLHTFEPSDPLSVLSAFGGFEIAMMAGFILGAEEQSLPVMVDGFISGAAFLVARAFSPGAAKTVFFAHRSAEQGHQLLLGEANAKPFLDLGLCLGEGTGAALGIGLLASGVSLFREMATFAEASVSDQ